MSKVITVEENNPPTITWPIGAYISEPSPVATAIGISPKSVVKVVIKIGRKREDAPSKMHSLVNSFSSSTGSSISHSPSLF